MAAYRLPGCRKYTCSEPEGAILELPKGASRYEVVNKLPFKELAVRNGVEWYKYAMRRGRDIANGSLYLVTSCTKCHQWGIAVVNRPCAPREGLRFVHNKKVFGKPDPKYSWKGSNAFTTTVAPTPDGNTLNHCVFLGGYKIRLREDIWNDLNEERRCRNRPMAMFASSQDEPNSHVHHQRHGKTGFTGNNMRPHPRTGELTTNALGQVDKLTNLPVIAVPVLERDEVILDADFGPPPIHPSDFINSMLLSQEPNARIAVTHDDAWCNLLGDIFSNPSSHLDLAKIAQLYTSSMDENGCISFEKISLASPFYFTPVPFVPMVNSKETPFLNPRFEPASDSSEAPSGSTQFTGITIISKTTEDTQLHTPPMVSVRLPGLGDTDERFTSALLPFPTESVVSESFPGVYSAVFQEQASDQPENYIISGQESESHHGQQSKYFNHQTQISTAKSNQPLSSYSMFNNLPPEV